MLKTAVAADIAFYTDSVSKSAAYVKITNCIYAHGIML